jgi:hypothetical protein
MYSYLPSRAAAAARMELGILGFDSALRGFNKSTFPRIIVSLYWYLDIESNIVFDDNVPFGGYEH